MAKRIVKPVEVTEGTVLGLSLKTFISLVVGLIFNVLLIAGAYYALKGGQSNHEIRITAIEQSIRMNNLDVLNYKVDQVLQMINELKK